MSENTKPASLTIHKVRLTRRHVKINYTNNSAEIELTEKDNPLPSFKEAIEALGALVLSICHLPLTYAEGMRVSGLTLTAKGLVTIQAVKSFEDASGPLNIATPLRFLDLPDEEGTYSPALTDAQVALVDSVLEEAKQYVLGNRAQGTLPLEEAKDPLDPDLTGEDEPLLESTQDDEPAAEEIAAMPKKTRKSRKPKAQVEQFPAQ